MLVRRFLVLIAVSIFLVAAALNARGVPRPEAIVWNGVPRTFVTSLYIGVLGRQPENQRVVTEWAAQVNNTPNSRHRVFWAFINSPEYQGSSWARQTREYNVYRRYIMQSDSYTYSVSKGPLGADNVHHSGPYSFGVAMALKNYYQTYFRRR